LQPQTWINCRRDGRQSLECPQWVDFGRGRFGSNSDEAGNNDLAQCLECASRSASSFARSISISRAIWSRASPAFGSRMSSARRRHILMRALMPSKGSFDMVGNHIPKSTGVCPNVGRRLDEEPRPKSNGPRRFIIAR